MTVNGVGYIKMYEWTMSQTLHKYTTNELYCSMWKIDEKVLSIN